MNNEYDEDMKEVKEEEIKIDPLMKEFAESSRAVLAGNPVCSGCGEIIGLKLALQAVENCILVTTGSASLLARYPSNYVNAPLVHADNPSAMATGISRSSTNKVMVYADSATAHATLQNIIDAAKRNANFIYICCNNSGIAEKNLYLTLARDAQYTATASVSHPEDYIRKLRKASSITGFRFIELLAPCPVMWGYDASNTIEVARLAVNTRLWPLVESEGSSLGVTVMPEKTENLETYLEMQKRSKGIKKEELEKMKNIISRNWKLISRK